MEGLYQKVVSGKYAPLPVFYSMELANIVRQML